MFSTIKLFLFLFLINVITIKVEVLWCYNFCIVTNDLTCISFFTTIFEFSTSRQIKLCIMEYNNLMNKHKLHCSTHLKFGSEFWSYYY